LGNVFQHIIQLVPVPGKLVVHVSKDNNNNARLTVIFQDNLGKLIPECLHSGFYWNNEDGSDGDNWSYKPCKAPVKSSPTYQHQYFYWHDVPVAQPTVIALKGKYHFTSIETYGRKLVKAYNGR